MAEEEQLSPELQLKEYESQLSDVIGLLQAGDGDDALETLKTDLEELIAITKQSIGAATQQESSAPPPPPDTNVATATATAAPIRAASAKTFDEAAAFAVSSAIAAEDGPVVTTTTDTAAAPVPAAGESEDPSQNIPASIEINPQQHNQQQETKKKSSKSKFSKEFEVPHHLIVHDTDSEAVKNRKRRALKAQKNKWREKKKEMESTQKQKSWQSFQKKKKVKTKDKSMFSTSDDGDAKVGVVGSKRGHHQLTSSGERKRHKHNL